MRFTSAFCVSSRLRSCASRSIEGPRGGPPGGGPGESAASAACAPSIKIESAYVTRFIAAVSSLELGCATLVRELDGVRQEVSSPEQPNTPLHAQTLGNNIGATRLREERNLRRVRSMSSPLFVLSHMRSYSSLLSHVLGSHPEIDGYCETHLRYRSGLD